MLFRSNGHREIPVTAVKSLAQLYKVSTDYLLRSDTNYTGSLDVNNIYVDGVTMRDIIVDMQTLKDTERKDLVKYIQFLCQDEKQGGRQR